MKKVFGKIVFVDDEKYEKDLLQIALAQKQWKVEVLYFSDAVKALEYLKETKDYIFLIISDLSMPGMNGLEFKKALDEDPQLCMKCLPFIFVSHGAIQKQINKAWQYRVQGYFRKPVTVDEQADMLDIIIRY